MGVRLATGGAAAVTVSPLAELVAALHVLDDPSHHEAHGAWAQALRVPAALDAELAGHAWLWRAIRPPFLLGGRVLDEAATADPTAELRDLAALGPARFRSAALAPLRAAPRRAARAAAAGGADDPGLGEQARTYARARGRPTVAVVERLLDDPAGARDRLVALLAAAWGPVLGSRWPPLRAALTADVRGRRDRAAQAGSVPSAALAATVGGLAPAVRVDGTDVVIDKVPAGRADAAVAPGLLLVPSVHGWPHVTLHLDVRFPLCLQYPLPRPRPPGPVPAVAAARATPAVRDVERRLAALADPVRLRLARSILREPRSTAELAEVHNLTPPAVSRHLRALRDAGLVTTDREGHFVRYRLEDSVLRRLGADLLEVLLR